VSAYTLSGAFVLAVQADPVLSALLPGGIHRVVDPEAAPPTPYAVVTDLGNPRRHNSGAGWVEEPAFQVSLFDDDSASLVAIVRQMERSFPMHAGPRALEGGVASTLYVANDFQGPSDAPGPGARRLIHWVVQLKGVVNRNPS
jgi:hypothetical protein